MTLTLHYLLIVAQEKFNYAVPELESIAKCFNIKLTIDTKIKTSTFLILRSISEDEVKLLLSRSVLVKDAFELWGFGHNLATLKESVQQFPSQYKEKWFSENCTFAVRIKGIGKKVSLSQQISKIEMLDDILEFKGKVKLAEPDVEIFVVEDYSGRKNGQPPDNPTYLYLGRFLCSGQRSLIEHYSVKKRKFIGNTSMDAMLSIIMANLACTRPNTLICDPFVGTGSLLISAAHFGSYVMGADINYNILHAQGKSSRKGAGMFLILK